MEHLNTMPVPQPARNPIADNSNLDERFELISKKYTHGLDPQQTLRLAEIEEYLDLQDCQTADSIEARSHERMGRINTTLDRVEKAIRDLQEIKPN